LASLLRLIDGKTTLGELIDKSQVDEVAATSSSAAVSTICVCQASAAAA
jgi:hypothetical protein